MGGSFDELPKRPMARETLVRVAKLYRPYRAALLIVSGSADRYPTVDPADYRRRHTE